MVAQVVLNATHVTIGISSLGLLLGGISLIMKINKNRKEMDALKLDKEVFMIHKADYEKHCDSNSRTYNELRDNQVMIQHKQNELLNKLVEQYTELRTDVKWIKSEWIKVRNKDENNGM